MAENYFGITDKGRQRQNNEDAFIAEKVQGDKYVMACVIDGVGGYEGGEIAAALAKETIRNYFSIPSGEIHKMMKEAIVAANEKILQEKLKNIDKKNMACVATLAIVDLKNNMFNYAHVGDTRLYLFRDNTLVKITKDHSFVGFLEDSGRLSEDAAMHHPKRNEISKALGFDGQMTVTNDYVEVGESPFLPGDAILLCSDGLTDMVNRSEMTTILQNRKSLTEKAKALVDTANNNGGKDNITVVLVQNTAKPIKQKATKPVVVKKKESTQSGANESQKIGSDTEVNKRKKPKRNRTVIILLSILSAGLLVILLYTFLVNRTNNVTGSTLTDSQVNISLEDTINRLAGDTLLINDSVFGNPITFTNLSIQKNSLYLKGNGNTVLTGDTISINTTPTIVITPSVKYVVFDSISFFDVAIHLLSDSTTVHFKDVQFRNVNFQHGQFVNIPDTIGYSGTLSEFLNIKKDSLGKQ